MKVMICMLLEEMDEVVTLNRRSLGVPGMWRCSIPDSTGGMQYIYIYTGGSPGFSADG